MPDNVLVGSEAVSNTIKHADVPIHEISGKTADELWMDTGKLRSELADLKADRDSNQRAGQVRIPDFDEVRDKRMSELSEEQRADAKELWIREQYGWFPGAAEHLKFLLERLDQARRTVSQV
ncbi:hypothetical protein [Cupriavidus malaysiensis]|uniref:Uncharacterized protein n=1 Tax=Cupriavidus malaysiensis TaxID=367825 RepID=A0ABN4U0D9_9BURK|nr:hypothetical protein [Cupriavidus malaysiensis]AOZ11125.1 hypothetical protein BKK80_34780 [Cupriavidus malaysiensis]